MDRLMLLDGNGLIYRGYFALPPLTTSRGELVNAVFGFCSIVLRGFQDIGPDFVAVAFDLPGPDVPPRALRRVQGDPPADAGRPARPVPEGPRGRQGAPDPGLRVRRLRGGRRHRHADGRGGTARPRHDDRDRRPGHAPARHRSHPAHDDPLRASRTRSSTTRERIRERYGLRPDQIVDFKALKGDSTDNVPGVPGVGEKTAAKLINRWATLDEVYEHIDEVEPVKLREPLLVAKERVLESRELMRIVRDLPVELDLEAARLGDYDRETVVRLFREYEFRTLIERLPAAQRRAGRRDGRSRSGPRPRTARSRPPRWPVALRTPAGGGATAAGRAAPPARHRCSGRRRGSSSRWTSMRSVGPPPVAPVPPSARARRPGSWTRPRSRRCPPKTRATRSRRSSPIRHGSPWSTRRPCPISGRGSRPSRPSASALLQDDPRPRRGTALALGVAGTDGRTIAADGAAASDALRRLLVEVRVPLVGHEVKRLLVGVGRRRRGAPGGRVRHPGRGVPHQRQPAQPDASPTSSPSSST